MTGAAFEISSEQYVQEVRSLTRSFHNYLSSKHQELDTKHQELDTKHQELDTKHQELDIKHQEHWLRTRAGDLFD